MPLIDKVLLAIVFAQVVLTLGLFLRLAVVRIPLYTQKDFDRRATALDISAWPEASRKLSSAIANQSELPVLFYVAAVLALVLGLVSWPLVVLMGLFVLFRYVHAFEFIGKNYVPRRFFWFLCSFTAICLIWVWLAIDLFVWH